MNAVAKIKLGLGGLAALAAEWLLIRFPLFGLHGMNDWPWLLFLADVIAVVIAGLLGAKWVVLGTLLGYLGGFFCGVIFDFPIKGDPCNGTTGWVVWTCVFLAGIAVGAVAPAAIALISKKKRAE